MNCHRSRAGNKHPANTQTRGTPAAPARLHSRAAHSVFGAPLLLLVTLIVLLVSPLSSPAAECQNVILLIGDGMGAEHVRAGSLYLHGEAHKLPFEGFPFQTILSTSSASDAPTDSAAAATAMATGHKVANGVISMAIPGNAEPLTTLVEELHAQGKVTGIVTTSTVEHATPAAFVAHVPERNRYEQIAIEMATRTRPRVVMGGRYRLDGQPQQNGYLTFSTREAMQQLDTNQSVKFWGEFGVGHMPYSADRAEHYPALHEMTGTALSILQHHVNGFFLLVEGARIDHASHANDTLRMVNEVASFSKAVSVAETWRRQHPETLLLVTADHETGGLEVVRPQGQGIPPAVRWQTTKHTARDVPVYASGCGATRVPWLLDNTDLHRLILNVMR